MTTEAVFLYVALICVKGVQNSYHIYFIDSVLFSFISTTFQKAFSVHTRTAQSVDFFIQISVFFSSYVFCYPSLNTDTRSIKNNHHCRFTACSGALFPFKIKREKKTAKIIQQMNEVTCTAYLYQFIPFYIYYLLLIFTLHPVIMSFAFLISCSTFRCLSALVCI